MIISIFLCKIQPCYLHSEAAILSYLKQHSKTADPYLADKKIIEAVAKLFADRDSESLSVELTIVYTITGLNLNLKLPEQSLIMMQCGLIEALMDCLNGKKVEVEKSKE